MFFSFIGDARLDDTAKMLLELSISLGLRPSLALVPEVVARALNAREFEVEESADHHDYVISLHKIASYQGEEFAAKRYDCRLFLSRTPAFRSEVMDLADPSLWRKIFDLCDLWQVQRGGTSDSDHDRSALERCVKSASDLDLIPLGLFVNETLIAFSIVGVLGNGHSICHFEKADARGFPGVYSFLRKQLAAVLIERGIEHMNLEQDLGVPGLRRSKTSYAPVALLRKYNVKHKVDET